MNGQIKRPPLWQVVFVLLGAPVLYIIIFIMSRVSFATFSNYAFLAGMTTEYIFLGVVLWFLHQSGRRLKDIGVVKGRWRQEVLLGLGLGVVLFMASGILIMAVERFLPYTVSQGPRPLWASLVFGFGLMTAFAPIEEIIWRGFAITFLRQHLNTWVAVVIASIAFGFMHWWDGPALIVESSIVGIIFSAVFLWRGTLLTPIVCHFVSDFPLFLFMLFAL